MTSRISSYRASITAPISATTRFTRVLSRRRWKGASSACRPIAVSLVGKTLVGARLTHFETAARVAVELVQKIERAGLPPDTVLNVNVPDVPHADLQGIRATRLGFRHKSEKVLKDSDPYGRPIYWIGPAGGGADTGEGTDFHAISEGAVSVTPLKVDLTRYEAVDGIAAWLSQ